MYQFKLINENFSKATKFTDEDEKRLWTYSATYESDDYELIIFYDAKYWNDFQNNQLDKTEILFNLVKKSNLFPIDIQMGIGDIFTDSYYNVKMKSSFKYEITEICTMIPEIIHAIQDCIKTWMPPERCI